MAEGELPPVIVDFIANVRDIIGPVNDAIAVLQNFRAAVERATADVRDFSEQTMQSGAEAQGALRTVAEAAQNVADAETRVTEATAAAVSETDRQRNAAIGDTLALEGQAAALRDIENDAYKAAAAIIAENAAARESADGSPSVIAAMEKIARAQSQVAHSAHSAAAATSFWAKHFQLSAGIFGTLPILGTVSGIELVLHGIMEFLAVFIPAVATATIGLVAWGLAAVQAGQQVFNQFKNISTVSNALNTTIPPLTGAFQRLGAAVRPQVFELLGEYLDMSSHSTGVLNKLIMETGQYLDHLFARIEVHSQASGGRGLAAFFDAGVKDLQLFGQIFSNVATVLMKFAQAAMQTHIAEILLGIVAAASQLLVILSKIPQPLLTAFVAFHGIALWGGLATTQLRNFALAIVQALGNIGPLNSAMTRLATGLGASTDALAKMGSAAPALKNITADIATGVPDAYQMAQAFQVSDANLANLVAKTPAVERVAQALGVGAQDVANFAVAANKSGVAVEDLAAKTAGSAEHLKNLTGGMEKGAQDAANLALAFLGTGKSAASAEEAVAKVGESAAAAGASSGLFARGLSSLATVLPGGPIAWLIALGVAIAGVGVYLGMMPDRTQKWINSLNQSVAAATDVNMLGTTVSALADDTKQLAEAQRTATGNATELANNQADLSGKLQLELQHVGALQRAYGISMPQALALLQTAGVKATDLFTKQGQVWKVDTEMVHGLVSGYQAMGQQIGAIGGDMNALLVSESQQYKAMQNVNAAWDAFTKIVSGPTDTILTLAASLQTFTQDAGKTGASMVGLGGSAVTLQQQFQTVYANVEQTFSAFRSAQAVNGGLGNFTQFVKNAVQALLPLAGSNRAAAAEISTLAQEAGGPASTNLAALAKWAGASKNPLKSLYDAAMQATVGTSNLSQDAAQLSNTLQSDMGPALAQATLTALGGQKTLSAFATDLVKLGPTSRQTVQAGRQVAEMFLSIDKNSKSAEAQFVGWAESMGMTASAATALWDKVSAGEKPLTSLRSQLASTSQDVANLGKPGLWGQVEHAFMAAWDGVFNWFKNSFPHAMEAGWDAVAGFFTKTIPAMWDAVWGKLAGPVTQAFASVKSAVMSVFDPWWKSHSQEMVTVVQTAWRAIHAVITTAWTVIAGFLRSSLSNLTTAWKETWDAISAIARRTWDIITGVIRTSFSIITGVFRTAWDIIWIIVKTALNAIKTTIQTIMGVILGVIGVVLDVITGHWGKAWNDMKGLTATAFHGIVGVITTIASGFGGLLYGAGRAIVQGLIGGINSMASAAWNTVTSLGSGLWNAAKHFFGFGSPSRLFMQGGRWIGEGLALGISGSAGRAVSEAHKMAQSVWAAAAAGSVAGQISTGLTSLNLGKITPSLLSTPGAGGVIVIHQDIKVNGQINEQTLFSFVKQSSYQYNIRNSGVITGTLKPGLGVI